MWVTVPHQVLMTKRQMLMRPMNFMGGYFSTTELRIS